MTGLGGPMAGVRRVDWRFLLPADVMTSVAVVGAIDEDLKAALGMIARRVVFEADDVPPDGTDDLVVAVDPSAPGFDRAIALVPPGGWIYVGSGHGTAVQRPSLRRVGARLLDEGFDQVRRSWHWPSEPAALEIVPIDDRRAVRYALDRRRSDRTARLKSTIARIALEVGWLDRIVPGWSVVGRRPEVAGVAVGSRTPGAVAHDLPQDLAGTPVVLFTPRFRSSRHVIGVALGTEHTPGAVIKRPRLVADDGGIRREAAALRRAAELGVPGVPRLVSIRGSLEPALVESQLVGRVISRRDVRARGADLIDEVEMWSRGLAGGPDRRAKPLEGYAAAALTRIGSTVSDALARTPSAPAELRELVGLVERTRLAIRPYDTRSVPVVLEHGDLAPPNLLRLRDGRLGVVDWEVADPEGLPLGDLLFFVAFVGSVALGTSGDRPPAQGVGAAIPPIASPAVQRHAAYLGLDHMLVDVLNVIMWARWADRQLARFADPADATPIGDRLPRRHVRSWATTLAQLEGRDRTADRAHPRYDAHPRRPER